MKTNLFLPAWYDEVLSIIHSLDMGLACRFGIASMRGPLERTRDDLHDIVSNYPLHEGDEEGEAVFLDLFDALSHVNDGLRHHPVIRGSIEQAVQILRRLRDQHKP